MGLDGTQKMSKSRGNAIMLCATEDETAKLIKKAKTDGIYFRRGKQQVSRHLCRWNVSVCSSVQPRQNPNFDERGPKAPV